eukprot:CAMPEP_0114238864 /NCGR_PEP_ID=MMETSP0058-20121206/8148_1 /TAXON_ID=36894 /ORGANISM="Pyramimonas parkeae, CCMP726" /LENGTH=286 /DNA_ID=CAMNT_0001350995 /DNA_START=286 /DNA_END=1146 /DNA_ORIENTATION=+
MYLPPEATQIQVLARAALLTSTAFAAITVCAVAANAQTRARVSEKFAATFKNNPELRSRLQQSLGWLVVVVLANWFTSVTGQPSVLNLLWVALFFTQITRTMMTSRASTSATTTAGDAPANSPVAPYSVFPSISPQSNPFPSPNSPQQPSNQAASNVGYGAEVTFRQRFPDLEGETLDQLVGACMLSEWDDGPESAKGPRNTSGQVYLTSNHICFHGSMFSSKSVSICMDEIARVEESGVGGGGGPLRGVRVHTKQGGCFDFTAASVFGQPQVDLAKAIMSRMTNS